MKLQVKKKYQKLLKYLKSSNKRQLSPIISIGLFGIIGLLLLIATKASPFTASLEAENGVKNNVSVKSGSGTSGGSAIAFGGNTGPVSCGKKVQNYTYQVPFGNAVWNQPVCNLARYSKSADYANRFIEWGHKNDGSPSADYLNGYLIATPGFPGTPTITDPEGLAGLFSREVYYASKATMQKKVSSIVYPSNLDGVQWNDNESLPKPGHLSRHPETTIPWNPSWKTGMGGDNEIFIIDDRPGKNNQIYTIWGYNVGGCVGESILYPDRVCGMSINISRDHWGNPINIMSHEGYVSERGVGLSYYATLTTPDEVQAGEIRHALGISIPNTSYGQICTKQQLGTDAEGKTCGTAVAPASKFEWGGTTSLIKDEPYKSIYTIDKTIPEGMRFAIDITDAQIESWINSRNTLKNNPRRAETARIFARALRDYGMIVVDTNGARPDIQMVGGVNPDNRTKWTNLAMGPDSGTDLLEGLINKNNLYVVTPPTLTCADNTTSQNYCKWTKAQY